MDHVTDLSSHLDYVKKCPLNTMFPVLIMIPFTVSDEITVLCHWFILWSSHFGDIKTYFYLTFFRGLDFGGSLLFKP